MANVADRAWARKKKKADGRRRWAVRYACVAAALFAASSWAVVRDADADIDTLAAAGNIDPMGIFSDGGTVWVVDNRDRHVYAYAAATGTRQTGSEFATSANAAPTGAWSDGTLLWVLDFAGGAYAYTLATGARAAERDLTGVGAYGATSLWSDGETFWVGHSGESALRAYAADGTRLPARDFAPAAADAGAAGAVWSNGRLLWVAHARNVLAYDFATREPSSDQGFELVADNGQPTGFWSDGRSLLVADWGDDVYGYRFAGGGLLEDLTVSGAELGFSASVLRYRVEVAAGVENVTVAARAPGDAAVAITPADADEETAGHQVDVRRGAAIEVAVDGGGVYRVAVERRAPENGLVGLAVNGVGVPGFFPAVLEYGVEVAHDVATATVAATAAGDDAVAMAPEDSDEDAAGHQVALTADGTTTATVTVAGETAYTVAITRPAADEDASLRSLALGGVRMGAFHGARTDYAGAAAAHVASTTVAALAAHADAAVSITPADDDADTAGHQVALAAGAETEVAATVAAADGETTRTYTVTVRRAPARDATAAVPRLPEDPTRASVLAHLREHGIGTVDAFVAALPRFHRSNFALVYESEALFPEAISHDAPRVVSWGAGADMVFAWAVDGDSVIGESVEFLEAVGDRWAAGIIDFGGAQPTIRHPAACASCHGAFGKPLWGQQEQWAGTEGELHAVDRYDVLGMMRVRVPIPPARAATERAARSTKARLAPLTFSDARPAPGVGADRSMRGAGDGVRTYAAMRESTNILALRHERVLAERLRGRADYATAVRDVVCRADYWGMARYFRLDEHNIAVRADTGDLVQGGELSSNDAFLGYAGGGGGRAFRFFVLDDLYRRDARVAEALGEHASLLDMLRGELSAYPSATLARNRSRWNTGYERQTLSIDSTLPEFYFSSRRALLWAAYGDACAALRERGAAPAPVPGEVSGLALVNARTGAVLGDIVEGGVFGRPAAGVTLAARADAGPGVGSVALELAAEGTGSTQRGASSARPFVVDFGTPARTGAYYLTATPYPKPELGGAPGRPRAVRFVLAEGGAAGAPAGAWSDGAMLWTTDADGGVLRAYRLGTGESLGRTLTLAADNDAPTGLWSDGSVVWVADEDSGRLHAYRLADGAALAGRDIALAAANAAPTGLWSNHETVWVADGDDAHLYAYDLVDGTRRAARDLRLATDNADPVDLWSNGPRLWVADGEDRRAYAYEPSGPAAKWDVVPPSGTPKPAGLWSDGVHAWLVPADGSDFVVVPLPQPGGTYSAGQWGREEGFGPSAPLDLTGLSVAGVGVGLARGTYEYAVLLPSGPLRAAVVATALAGAAVEVVPADADADTDGHQVDLAEGFTRLDVFVRRGTRVARYGVDVYRGSTTAALEVAFQPAEVSEGGKARLRVALPGGFAFREERPVQLAFSGPGAQANDYEVPAYRVPLLSHTSSLSTTVKAVRDSRAEAEEQLHVTASLGSGLSGTATLTIRASTAPADIETLSAAGNGDPRGIWSDGDTLWVADDADEKLYAYALADGARRPARDIATLAEAGNGDPNGVWSDGDTVWVADGGDFKIFAYGLADGDRRPSRDLGAAGDWLRPQGLWSDGEFMFISSQETGSDNCGLNGCRNSVYLGTRLGVRRLADGAWRLGWLTSVGDRRLQIRHDAAALWSDGRTLWTALWSGTRLGVRDESWDVRTIDMATLLDGLAGDPDREDVASSPRALPARETSGNDHPAGLWSDGELMYVSDSEDAKIYVYEIDPSPNATLTRLGLEGATVSPTFSPRHTGYQARLPNGVARARVLAFPAAGATLAVTPPDADADAPGHQVDVDAGGTDIEIAVTAANGSTRTYTMTATHGSEPAATVAATAASVGEGSAASFAVSLSAPSAEALSVAVSLAAEGAALSAAVPESVSFAAGETTATLTV